MLKDWFCLVPSLVIRILEQTFKNVCLLQLDHLDVSHVMPPPHLLTAQMAPIFILATVQGRLSAKGFSVLPDLAIWGKLRAD